MRLSELKIGQVGYVTKVAGVASLRKRLSEMGFIPGQEIIAKFSSPLGDPITYQIMGYDVALRRSEANVVEISAEEPKLERTASCPTASSCLKGDCCHKSHPHRPRIKGREINVVLVGNPNAGKTTLFNALSGGHERVGNYSGVTVSEKVGSLEYQGYKLNIIDLPGTYSLSAFSPEERYVQYFLFDKLPDLVVNVVDASTLERNLYLTTQLMDLDLPMVGALNMYDEIESSNSKIDLDSFAEGLGMPIVPISAKNNRGINELLSELIAEYERHERKYPLIQVGYTEPLEREICSILGSIDKSQLPPQFPARYWVYSLMQRNTEAEQRLGEVAIFEDLSERCTEASKVIAAGGESVEHIISNSRYDFIASLLSSTFTTSQQRSRRLNERIDSIVTHRWLGLPIFMLLMWITFSATFTLGAYPMEWIEMGIEAFSSLIESVLPDGVVKNLVIDGMIAGMGGVLVFLPNIVILYLFIVIMEGSGYMARAAFIMDRIMRSVGLDGRSFIPYMMGFGCNVPAIMATRTIENRKVRLITILTNPFMSCSARLPVFILFAGAFFPHNAGTVITLLYLLGILFAILTAMVLGKTIRSVDDSPFILELPPYRFPTTASILSQLWNKCERYLKRIGSLILVASIIIWALDYFPLAVDGIEQRSYLQQLGELIEPIMSPLGFDWRANVALFSGVAAKELIIGTMGILYEGSGEIGIEALSHAFTTPSAVAYMLFILLYFPCIGTLAAIAGESDKPKLWAAFSILYNTMLAWIVAYLGYHITLLLL